MLVRLALAEDDLGNALAQAAVQVELGVAQILEWERAQSIERVVEAESAVCASLSRCRSFSSSKRYHLIQAARLEARQVERNKV